MEVSGSCAEFMACLIGLLGQILYTSGLFISKCLSGLPVITVYLQHLPGQRCG